MAEVTINSRKYDGSLHRTWKAELVSQNAGLLIFTGVFESDVEHPHLGSIRSGTISQEYYWTGKYFNVFKFHEPTGEFRNYYCNISLLPVFDRSTLDYIDLDVDIVLWSDRRVDILDFDEFLENARGFGYSAETHRIVLKAIGDLSEMIQARAFPFDDPGFIGNRLPLVTSSEEIG